jgi:hypothetical protein
LQKRIPGHTAHLEINYPSNYVVTSCELPENIFAGGLVRVPVTENARMTVDVEFERTWKEAAVVQFEMFPWGECGNSRKDQSGSRDSGQRFEPRTPEQVKVKLSL